MAWKNVAWKNMAWKKIGRDLLGITIGAAILAAALNMFLIPNKIAAGGVSGLGIIVYHLLGFPVGLTMLVINIPLFATGIKKLGWAYGFKSLYGATIFAVLVDLLAPFLTVPTADHFLATLFGGILSGIGVGIVFRFHGSTGGTALAAALINRMTGIPLGQSLLFVDGLVILLAGIFFNLELAMWAIITVFLTSKVIDYVQEGISAKAVFIISIKQDEVAQAILEKVERGGTALQGRGLYTGSAREIILTVVNQSQISRVKEVVYEIDEKAFIIVTDVREVLGEGFRRRF